MGGRGGAGNVFPASERAIFSFDEELERQLRWERDVAPASSRGSESGADVFNRGVKKGWKKIVGGH